MKEKRQAIRYLWSLLFFVFSLFAFSYDKPSVNNSNTSIVKFEDDDGIVSGRQQALSKTNTVFIYNDSSIYGIYLKPNYLTTLKLQPGEKVLFFAGGDTERWALEDSAGGRKNQPLVFIKPDIEDMENDMDTNVIIVTDKHIYNLNLEMSYDKYNPMVEWTYPNEAKIIIEAQERNTTGIGTDDLTKLNYNYNWTKNSPLSPDQVFDNGENTFLVMKKEYKELPAIYVRGVDNQLSLVTTKVNGRYITIDRTTREILLMLGKKSLKIYNKSH